MNSHSFHGWLVSGVVMIGLLAGGTPAAGDDQEVIASAMMAAPKAVAEGATILAMEADGSMRVVREGTNGFTCIPDSPATPGPDPMCADANAMEWVQAWIEHREPSHGKVGFMFMLQGGTDASNTDPYAQQPEEGNNWIQTGPHVMIVGGDDMLANYPRDADPDTSVPYVMWADTQYAHLMIPVE
jgi:hypothetical protein